MPDAPRFAAALIVVAGIYGAAGVATAAAAAHRVEDPLLATASNILLIHAAALPGVTAAAVVLGAGRLLTNPAWALALGVLLFSGDLTLRALFDVRPFPMAAPIGGALLILGWLGVAAGAAFHWRRRRRIG